MVTVKLKTDYCRVNLQNVLRLKMKFAKSNEGGQIKLIVMYESFMAYLF